MALSVVPYFKSSHVPFAFACVKVTDGDAVSVVQKPKKQSSVAVFRRP
jgi:hypothetical protein